MADLPTNGMLYVWISRDSQKVLGQDPRSPDYAYADAQRRHPQDCAGYPVQVLILNFPAGTNPVIAIAHAFWQSHPPTGIEGLGAPEPVQPPKLTPVPKDSEPEAPEAKPKKKEKSA